MSRGITETDVWNACDVLLLEGARPTIERVRQKIGRGSPNTVGPCLDTWFKHLGGRIKDPGVFAAPPDVPEPIQQAARHVWEMALDETRRDFDLRLQQAMAAAVAQVQAEQARSAHAYSDALAANARSQQLRAELVARDATLEAEKLAHAGTAAHLESARQQIDELRGRLEAESTSLATLRDLARREVAAADERSAGAERRAALEIEGERNLRSKAEKRMEGLERKLEASQADLLAARSRQVETSTRLQGDLARAADELARVMQAHGLASRQVNELASSLADAQRRADVAEARAALGERVLERLGPPATTLVSTSKSEGRMRSAPRAVRKQKLGQGSA